MLVSVRPDLHLLDTEPRLGLCKASTTLLAALTTQPKRRWKGQEIRLRNVGQNIGDLVQMGDSSKKPANPACFYLKTLAFPLGL